MGRGLVSQSGLVKCPPLIRLVAGLGYKKTRFSAIAETGLCGFQEIKKALALFRAHLWFDYLLSPLPKVDTLITFHRKRGEKRAGLSLNVIPCLGIFFSGLSRKVYPGPKSLAESLSVKESKI